MINLVEKYGKKNVSIFAGGVLTLAIVVGGTGVWYVNEQNHKEEVLASIDLTFKEEVFVEYGQEKVDYNEYVKEKIGEPEVTIPTNEIDTKILAKHELTYKIGKDGYSKDAKLTLEVKDTKAPEINIKEETVTLEYGSEYDIKENIESVKDPVDGDVPYTESAGENNYYIVEGTVDTATSGDYTITIKAMDKNKTESEKTYTVHVNEEQAEEPASQPSNGGNGYAPPSNNSGGSYTPPSYNGGNATPPPTTCSADGQWKSLGNSGVAFYSQADADAWANENCDWDNYYYVIGTVHDVCGNTGYSPHWMSY